MTPIEPTYVDEGFVGDHWGSAGSGLLLTTGRKVLVLRRSGMVLEPGQWGVPGGAVPVDLYTAELRDHLESALVESVEEMGGVPPFVLFGKTIFVCGSFRYTTFLGRVSSDDAASFIPRLNWEHDDWTWARRGELDGLDLHAGLAFTLAEAPAIFNGNGRGSRVSQRWFREQVLPSRRAPSSVGGVSTQALFDILQRRLSREPDLQKQLLGASLGLWVNIEILSVTVKGKHFEVSVGITAKAGAEDELRRVRDRLRPRGGHHRPTSRRPSSLRSAGKAGGLYLYRFGLHSNTAQDLL